MATKNKKLSIADLQSKPKRVTITHPSLELVDTWVDIIPAQQSLDYMLTVMKVRNLNIEDLDPREQFRLQAELVVAVIKDWSEESFGFKFETEKAINFFMEPANLWIREQIETASKEDTDFFTNA